LMILLYTFEGGVKTIVWTDTLQTTCMLAGLVICIIYILKSLNLHVGEGIAALKQGGYTTLFVSNQNSRLFFIKQILAVPLIAIVFIIALISALFPSADGAITALTSSFCIDLLGLKRRDDWDEKKKKNIRRTVHLIVAALFFLVVLIFKWVNNQSMIGVIL